ncbi:hypothetical protein UY3_10476 [Chelonia mydas]|uniref:Uncharacterized protein n=1 Tax=Chelonia mydas TaxID=8469 RepID=M7B5I9_CHEMY|nr:hypothetical protein UY3_10476 [Chelonia mydas]
MESALTPTPTHLSESAPGIVMSVRRDILVPSTSRHRSLSSGHAKKARKMPSSQLHQRKPSPEARPMSGSSRSPPASRPRTHLEQSSPAPLEQTSLEVRMPSTPEALKEARDVMSMPVPEAPPMLAPRFRGKPPLGSPQSPAAWYRSRSREHSQCRSPPSNRSGKSPHGSPLTPTRLSGWVPSNRDSRHCSTSRSKY